VRFVRSLKKEQRRLNEEPSYAVNIRTFKTRVMFK
jgi:hypothetical protein